MGKLKYEIENPLGLRVYAYRNLQTGGVSLMMRGRVIKHVDRVLLSNVKFVVREKGLTRLRLTGYRNVHAFAVGTVQSLNFQIFNGREAWYRPFYSSCFTDKETGKKLEKSSLVSFEIVDNKSLLRYDVEVRNIKNQ